MNIANEIKPVKRHQQLEKLLRQVIANMTNRSEIIREIHSSDDSSFGTRGCAPRRVQKVSTLSHVQEVLHD